MERAEDGWSCEDEACADKHPDIFNCSFWTIEGADDGGSNEDNACADTQPFYLVVLTDR